MNRLNLLLIFMLVYITDYSIAQETISVERLKIIGASDHLIISEQPEGNHLLIGTYPGWDKKAIYIAGYGAFNRPDVAVTERVFIGNNSMFTFNLMNGRMGIGVNNPSDLLHVNGMIRANELMLHSGVYFSQSGNHNDGKPYARLLESWGIRFASPDSRWVLSSAPSVLIGYQPAGESWGNGNLFVQNKLGIGTTSPTATLTVAGNIHAQEIKVISTAGADFVFDESYNLRSLEDTDAFIKENKHLPDIPSAREMVEDGISLGDMNIKLLQKIEELTLHVIELNKDNEEQTRRLERLEQENERLKEK
jgi:hypothetical protein